MNGRWAEAIAAYGRAVEIDPDDFESRGHRALSFYRNRDNADAVAEFDAAVSRDPTAHWARATKADIHIREKAWDKAQEDILAVDRAGGHDDEAAALRIQFALARHDGQAAFSAADRRFQAAPSAEASLNRADARPEADDAGREADARVALKLDPTSVRAARVLIRALDAQDRPVEALAIADQLVAAGPDDTFSAAQRGAQRFRTGDMTGASKDFAAARAAASENATALDTLCREAGRAGFALEQALADCDSSLKLVPANPLALDSRAYVLLRLGRDEEAVRAYDSSLAVEPYEPRSYLGRSFADARLGRAAVAAKDRATAVDQDEGVEIRLRKESVTR